jgi:hypothetical protein
MSFQASNILLSCFTGDPDLTRWILKHTVDDSGNSYTRHGEIDVIQQLLDQKVNTDVNKCRDSGESPLYIVQCLNVHSGKQ